MRFPPTWLAVQAKHHPDHGWKQHGAHYDIWILYNTVASRSDWAKLAWWQTRWAQHCLQLSPIISRQIELDAVADHEMQEAEQTSLLSLQKIALVFDINSTQTQIEIKPDVKANKMMIWHAPPVPTLICEYSH